jgi:hypothetical protein
MATFSFPELGLTEIAIVLVAIGYVTHLVLDALGISRTSKTLRQENEDLVRRNRELEEVGRRMEAEVVRLKGELDLLVPQIVELTARDQGAVLRSLDDHERQANIRHEALFGVLVEIRDTLRANNTANG